MKKRQKWKPGTSEPCWVLCCVRCLALCLPCTWNWPLESTLTCTLHAVYDRQCCHISTLPITIVHSISTVPIGWDQLRFETWKLSGMGRGDGGWVMAGIAARGTRVPRVPGLVGSVSLWTRKRPSVQSVQSDQSDRTWCSLSHVSDSPGRTSLVLLDAAGC